MTPVLAPRVRSLWDACMRHGVLPGLLVVPDWHGKAPIEGDAAFAAWLRECAARGAEIFLHGERHDEVGLPRRWRDTFRAAGRTNREGEFLTLGYAGARERIDRGLERLRTLGLDPIGFVPPAWLCRAETHEAARDAGLAVSEDDGTVYVHRCDAAIPSPVLRWSSRGATRAWGSVLQAALRRRLQRGAPVMRIALHPADLDHPVTAASLARELDAWLALRRAGRYVDLEGSPVSVEPPGAGIL